MINDGFFKCSISNSYYSVSQRKRSCMQSDCKITWRIPANIILQWQLCHTSAAWWLPAPLVCCLCCVHWCQYTSVGLLSCCFWWGGERPNFYMTILRCIHGFKHINNICVFAATWFSIPCLHWECKPKDLASTMLFKHWHTALKVL